MPVQVLMPALSPTMEEGNLVKWHKKEGDIVKSGQILAEIETDKATMEIEAVDAGILGKIVIPEGTQNVKVNQLIALILEEGEDISSLDSFKTNQHNASTSSPTPPIESPLIKKEEPSNNDQTRVIASPLAKKIASIEGVDLAHVIGTGPKGRIIKDDVELSLKQKQTTRSSSMASSYTDIPLTTMRKTIAKRLTESKQTIPHFYLTLECQIDNLLNLRTQINAGGHRISINDFIIKACAQTLIDIPETNVTWNEGFIRQYHQADISVAVAIEGGLMTPIVKAANAKSLKSISNEVKSLVERAKGGRLKPEDYTGGSLTISNLGMYGIKQFSAIINPPQACILAVGTNEKRVIPEGSDTFKVATFISFTLSVDHRAVDGAVAAKFLNTLKTYIENPISMIFE